MDLSATASGFTKLTLNSGFETEVETEQERSYSVRNVLLANCVCEKSRGSVSNTAKIDGGPLLKIRWRVRKNIMHLRVSTCSSPGYFVFD